MSIDLGVLMTILSPVIAIGGAIVSVMKVYNTLDKKIALAEMDRHEMRKDIDAIGDKGRTSTTSVQDLKIQIAEMQATLDYIKGKMDRWEARG
jgi:hypothetical protein